LDAGEFEFAVGLQAVPVAFELGGENAAPFRPFADMGE